MYVVMWPMKQIPEPDVVTAWVRLMRAQHEILSHVEDTLKQAKFPPLSWYDVLLELERVGDKGMRPYELEAEMLVPQYGVSRLLKRIEAAGYIDRRVCDDDKRGQVVVINQAGLDLRQKMWPLYAKAIQSGLGERLSIEEAKSLGALLSKLCKTDGA
jgi:DNA-binding MarR family transcriptional regulator